MWIAYMPKLRLQRISGQNINSTWTEYLAKHHCLKLATCHFSDLSCDEVSNICKEPKCATALASTLQFLLDFDSISLQ